MMSIASLSCATHAHTIKPINHHFYCKTFMMGRPFGWGPDCIQGDRAPGPPLVPALASTFLLSKTAVVLIILQNDNPYKKLYVVPRSRSEKY